MGYAADVGKTLRPLHMLRDALPAVLDVAALAEHPRAIGVLELDIMMIVNLAMLPGHAHLSPPLPLGANRVGPLEPVDDVEVVDMLLTDMVAR